MKRKLIIAVLCLAVICNSPPVSAHPDLEDYIKQVTAKIEKHPGDPALLLERADFFRRHAQFKEAFADISKAESLKPDQSTLLLIRARTYHDSGETEKAFTDIEKFLASDKNHPEALVIHARCLVKMKKFERAIADFSNAIGRLANPSADLFLERAQAQAALKLFADAAKGLDEGMLKVGEIPPMQMAAIEYDRQRGDFDAALARVNTFIARYPVKEPWLTLRGEVLEQAGRKEEAIATYQQVITGIESYPALRRGLVLTHQLEERVRKNLARVQSGTSNAAPQKSLVIPSH